MTTPFCEDVIFAICGKDPELNHNLNQTRMEIYVSHTPAGTGMFNMEHWAQMIRNESFQMYDWGPAGNEQHYNQSTPPLYHLANVNSPTALFTGGDDLLADPTDVLQLISELPAQSVVKVHNEPDYEHLDFTWGMDAAVRIYPEVLELLQHYATAN